MENPDLPDSARKDLKVILEESHRTREIVKNLLSFARQRPPQRQSLQVNTLLERTVALRAYDLANSAIEVVEKFDDNIPALVGDAHQLQQVFLNILNNAFDAVRGVGRPGQIEIETRQQQDWIEISFRDNGEGIKYPERIFDPFFTTKEVGKGTGLGLSICYGIVREHEGEILCSNNKETPGATFVVRLPVHAKSGQKMVTATRGQA
jgi:two-component system NtrC family sensor kinase